MPRYIDADALSAELINKDFYPAIVKRAIEKAPTADVVEVARGKWTLEVDSYRIGEEYDQEGFLRCSECGRIVPCLHFQSFKEGEFEKELEEYPYCHCGAKMNLEVDDGKVD